MQSYHHRKFKNGQRVTLRDKNGDHPIKAWVVGGVSYKGEDLPHGYAINTIDGRALAVSESMLEAG